jgi:hypothetical protein
MDLCKKPVGATPQVSALAPCFSDQVWRILTASARIRVTPEVYEDDILRRNLLKAALDFTKSLPKK